MTSSQPPHGRRGRVGAPLHLDLEPLEGVFARYKVGQYGESDDAFQQFARIVDGLAEAADEAEKRLG